MPGTPVSPGRVNRCGTSFAAARAWGAGERRGLGGPGRSGSVGAPALPADPDRPEPTRPTAVVAEPGRATKDTGHEQ
ncbi:hypothetical protein GCM10009864_23590 [Streptomyces lunalinharesii]|uniref:Uncharacterized protein n=1 Tax=Streptomyces lunalinharesii TaxID=333384 RepID=A0ABP6E378_9ACTN